MMKVLTIILFAVFYHCCADKDGVPVFVIDDEGTTSHWNFHADPFKKIGTSYFADIVAESTRRNGCVIIFIEEQFSTEDISQKDVLGTPFTNLRESLASNKVRYIPSVSQPYKILTNLFPPRKSNIFYIDDAEKFSLPEYYFKYFFVIFQDAFNATRIECLRHHDTIIKEVIKKVKAVKTGPVIAFYTGKRNPAIIEEMDYSKKYHKSAHHYATVRSKIALFRLSGIHSATQHRRSRFTQTPSAVEITATETGYSTIMNYTDFQLRFVFRFTENDWTLNTVDLMESNQTVGRTSTNIGAPWGWSYICASPLAVLNTRDSSYLVIPRYQIQPFQENVTAETPFNKGVNCEPYFNSQILAGLFVSVICLSIVATGIMFLMDCKINNKYDDPNGKEIMTKDVVAQS